MTHFNARSLFFVLDIANTAMVRSINTSFNSTILLPRRLGLSQLVLRRSPYSVHQGFSILSTLSIIVVFYWHDSFGTLDLLIELYRHRRPHVILYIVNAVVVLFAITVREPLVSKSR